MDDDDTAELFVTSEDALARARQHLDAARDILRTPLHLLAEDRLASSALLARDATEWLEVLTRRRRTQP